MIHHLLSHTNGDDWLRVNRSSPSRWLTSRGSLTSPGGQPHAPGQFDDPVPLKHDDRRTRQQPAPGRPARPRRRADPDRPRASTTSASRTAGCAACICHSWTRRACTWTGSEIRASGWRRSEKRFEREQEQNHRARRASFAPPWHDPLLAISPSSETFCICATTFVPACQHTDGRLCLDDDNLGQAGTETPTARALGVSVRRLNSQQV